MRQRIKQNIINTLLYARRDWDHLLAQVDEAIMVQSGVCGKWSVKDLIAHTTWYENEMEELFRTLKLQGSPLWELHHDERNEAIYQKNQFRSLDDVKMESLQVFAHLLTALEALDPADLLDPERIQGMPGDWQATELLASNTWSHYSTHTAHIQAFLAKR